MQCFDCYCYHPERLARMAKLPARNCDHAIGLEVLEILPECLHRVEVVSLRAKAPAAVDAQSITKVICTTSKCSAVERRNDRPSVT